MKHRFRGLLLCGMIGLGAGIAGAIAQRNQWSTATAQDIVKALGPDAQGLSISEETLPDLFELTASRLEENPKNFVIAQPYTAGRWQGGRAVIEYARDLSYTLVSIYDKSGRRQRIYSVITKPRELTPAEIARSQTPAAAVDLETVDTPQESEPTDIEPVQETPAPEPKAREEKKSKKEREAKAASTQVATARMTPPVSAPATGSTGSSVWMPSATGKSQTAPATSGDGNVSYEWSDQQGSYVPVKKGGAAASRSTPPPPPVVAATPKQEEPIPSSKKRKNRKTEERTEPVDLHPVPEMTSVPPPPPTNTSNVWMPSATSPAASKGSNKHVENARPTDDTVPSTDELLADNTPTLHQQEEARRPESKRSKKSKEREVADETTVVDIEPVSDTREPDVRGKSSNKATPPSPEVAWGAKKKSPEAVKLPGAGHDNAEPIRVVDEEPTLKPATTMTPSEIAAATASKKKSDRKKKSDPKVEEAAPAVVDMEPVEDAGMAKAAPVVDEAPVKGKSTMTPSELAAAEAAKREREAKSRPAPAPVKTAKRSKSEIPSTEELLDSSSGGPETGESDRWVPKKVARVAAEPEIPEAVAPVKVAMIPKASPPPEATIDHLLKVAEQNQKVTTEGDSWVPKKAEMPKGDQEVIAELDRIRAQKPAPVKPQVKVKRDINNPEEGVMPVNSFEKFSGPRYGRHREYERRFFYGKRSKAPVKDYDFYVDEVDRKKEIHNVYYYKKGKAPKLVAVERHSKVTFLSNYDVDKEDAGKVNTY